MRLGDLPNKRELSVQGGHLSVVARNDRGQDSVCLCVDRSTSGHGWAQLQVLARQAKARLSEVLPP